MDSGGLDLERTIEWVDEGIKRLAEVLSGSSSSLNWDREDWGATFDALETRAYSLYDESCLERVPTASFQRLLTAWREFISANPKSGEPTVIDL